MPRTKLRKTKISKDAEIKIADIKRRMANNLRDIEANLNRKLEVMINSIDVEFYQYPSELHNLTLGTIIQLLKNTNDEDYNEENTTETVSWKSRLRTSTSISDDGYYTDKMNQKVKKVSTIKRDMRSKLTASVKKTAKKVAPSNIYAHTPAQSKPSKIEPVTPKVILNAPINVLRKPRNGETVISMEGSPILVTSVLQDNTANVSVPLRNGNVISLLPSGDLRQSMLPTISPRTKEQLRKLKNHIEKFIS